MDIQATLKELSKQLGPPTDRAAFGQWVSSAWLVRGLVEAGYGVSAAVRQVLESSGHGNNEKAFGSVRAAYYKCKDQEWPAAFSNAAVKKGEEGFE